MTEIKLELGVKKPELAIHFVLCGLNYRTVPRMIELCSNLGVEKFNVQALNIWSEEMRKFGLLEEQSQEAAAVLANAEALARTLRIRTNIGAFLGHDLGRKANAMDRAMLEASSEKRAIPLLNVPCYRPWFNIAVMADGRVLPCSILREEGVSCREKTLSEIWAGSYFKRARVTMASRHLGPDCRRCNPWTFAQTYEIRRELSA